MDQAANLYRTCSVTEARRELGVRSNWIYQLIRDGDLTAEKYDNKWRITAVSIEAYKARLAAKAAVR